MGYCSITTIRLKGGVELCEERLGTAFVPLLAGIRQLMRKFPAPTAFLTVCAIAVLSWSSSAPGIAQAQTANSCVTGGAVEDATNTGLISDCETLLDAWDTLAASSAGNWSANNPITVWQSVTVEGTPKRVTELAIPGFRLTGAIPSELGDLANLQLLDLRDNQLTGAIPSELGYLANLQELNLSGNQLTGAIPSELGDLANLQELRLSRNQLSGAIPSELGDLANLEALYLRANQLTGAIPSELGDLANLQELNLSGNQLAGAVPSELGDLVNLRVLFLAGNQLIGEIPSELGGLANLQELNLNGNQLTGAIPSELGDLANLQELNLNGNQLTGAIPSELGDLADLQELILSRNQLAGAIPSELGDLANLQKLNFVHNHLSGRVPPELGSLSNLQVLVLRSNHLSGRVPPELANLSNLVELVLSKNSLWCIPEVVRQLLPDLIQTDIHLLPVCTEEDFVALTVDEAAQIYNDNVFVLPVAEYLDIDELPMQEYAARFFQYFDDEFDFLIFVSNVYGPTPGGTYRSVMNDVEGIGAPIFNNGYGSVGSLQGVIHLSKNTAFSEGPVLHELMHRWANRIVPTSPGVPYSHWGFSSAKGQLGGFDIADLVEHGDDRYSVSFFPPAGWRAHSLPYSPIELYLAGLIPPEEVPDLWVAADGKWLYSKTAAGCVRADNGDCIFTATNIRTYTIEDIISEHGRRVPDASQAQRDFRAAAILLIDKDHPANNRHLDQMSGHITSFSKPGADEFDGTYNFWEATDGRATLTMDGLSQFRKPVTSPGSPTELIVTRNSPTQIDLWWSEPSSYGGSAITAYDLRHVETSADETVDSNWTVVQDVWTAGSGALRYTVAGFSDGSQYDFQVRAVNAAGDGPWSDTATGPPSTQRVCVTGGAVANAASNPWLVSDCEALLAARDTLTGSATLNWSADTPIAEWHGVTVEGTPGRVTRLSLGSQGLAGAIPSKLGDLTNLRWLDLEWNQLSGEIPSELGDLVNLESLFLRANQLSGAIPSKLGDLVNLRLLFLEGNQLSGAIPPELGDLALEHLYLRYNQLTGCVPAELRDVAYNDLDELGLPFCDAANSSPEFPATETGKRNVAENTAPGKNVGAPVEATDAGDGTLIYTLGGADAALFAIDSGTGQMTVGAGATLDYETKTSHTVVVTATDPSDASAIITVTITVTDVDLGPLGSRYDADNDEVIDGEEVLTAIVDYFDDVITRDDVLELISLYFS